MKTINLDGFAFRNHASIAQQLGTLDGIDPQMSIKLPQRLSEMKQDLFR